MANTLELGNGKWATGKDTVLAYNDLNNNFKPLPFDFTRASSATVVNKDGLIETVGIGIPRIDFKDNTKGALKLEPQRTNLITYSEDFSQWTGSSYVTSNYAISPDGTQNASRVLFTGASQELKINTTTSASTVGTLYVKGISGKIIRFGVEGAETNYTLNGEWQRLEALGVSTANKITINTYGSTTARDFLIWGAQLEDGDFASSYIPTSGSIKTRSADVCNNGGNEQVFNDSEGVLYTEMSALANDATNRRITISDNTLNNRVVLGFDETSNAILALVGSSGTQFVATPTISDVTSNNKFALKYKQNDFALWINGVEVATDTSGNTPVGLSTLNIHGSTGFGIFHGNLKDVRVYNTALTDSELQALTTI